MIKGKELKNLVSATANDIAIHNAIVAGLDSIFEEDWDYDLKLMWYNFREILNFETDIQEYHYSIFVDNLSTMLKGYQINWENEAKSYIKLLQLSIARLHIYKDCFSSDLSIKNYEVLKNSIIATAKE